MNINCAAWEGGYQLFARREKTYYMLLDCPIRTCNGFLSRILIYREAISTWACPILSIRQVSPVTPITNNTLELFIDRILQDFFSGWVSVSKIDGYLESPVYRREFEGVICSHCLVKGKICCQFISYHIHTVCLLSNLRWVTSEPRSNSPFFTRLCK